MSRRFAIIVAGGSGRRFGGALPKQFLPLAGSPVLRRSVEAFAVAGATVAVVLPQASIALWRQLCKEHGITVSHSVVAGGAERFHSVRNALAYLSPQMRGGDLVAVHDGVRPLASQALIERAYAAAAESGAVVPAVPVTDTIRQLSHTADGASCQLDRNLLRAVQTPQVFEAGLLQKAYEAGFSPLFTDDASVVESTGKAVTLIDGEPTNMKITHPFDLTVAEAIIAARQQTNSEI